MKMKHATNDRRPATPPIEELELHAWQRLTTALHDYAAALAALEYLTNASIQRGAGPAVPAPGAAHLDLAAATCARARRACEDALLLLDTLTGQEPRPLRHGTRYGYLDEGSPAAS